MPDDFADCDRCRSAGSVERGRCQICMAVFEGPATVIQLDDRRPLVALDEFADALDA